MLASSTLSKAAFLCSVLAEETECHHLAFKVGMFGLEMPRPPASSKALEVNWTAVSDYFFLSLAMHLELSLEPVWIV